MRVGWCVRLLGMPVCRSSRKIVAFCSGCSWVLPVVLLFFAAVTLPAEDVTITPTSPEGQNISNAAQLLEDVGQKTVADQIRQRLNNGDYSYGSVKGNAETGTGRQSTKISTGFVHIGKAINGGVFNRFDLILRLACLLFHENFHSGQSYFIYTTNGMETPAWTATINMEITWVTYALGGVPTNLWSGNNPLGPGRVLSPQETLALVTELHGYLGELATNEYFGLDANQIANYKAWETSLEGIGKTLSAQLASPTTGGAPDPPVVNPPRGGASTGGPSTSGPSTPQPPAPPQPPPPPPAPKTPAEVCPECLPYLQAVIALRNELADVQRQITAQNAKIAANLIAQRAAQTRIAALQAALAAQEGTGGSGYDPETGETRESVTQADGTVRVTVRDANGNVLEQSVRNRSDLAGVQRDLNAAQAQLESLKTDGAALAKERDRLVAREQVVTARLQDAIQQLADCLKEKCSQLIGQRLNTIAVQFGLDPLTGKPAPPPKKLEGSSGVQGSSGEQGGTYRMRWYSPSVGQFLTPGPAGFGNGANQYGLNYGDPVNFGDYVELGQFNLLSRPNYARINDALDYLYDCEEAYDIGDWDWYYENYCDEDEEEAFSFLEHQRALGWHPAPWTASFLSYLSDELGPSGPSLFYFGPKGGSYNLGGYKYPNILPNGGYNGYGEVPYFYFDQPLPYGFSGTSTTTGGASTGTVDQTSFINYLFVSTGFANAHGQYVLPNYTTFSPGVQRLFEGTTGYPITSHMVNEARASFNRLNVDFGGNNPVGEFNWNFPVVQPTTPVTGYYNPGDDLEGPIVKDRLWGNYGYSGIRIGNSTTTPVIGSGLVNTWQAQDNWNYVLGKHQFKAGVNWTYQKSPYTVLPSIGSTTWQTLPGSSNFKPIDFRQYDTFNYFGDDWKIGQNLTLNLGLTWTYYGQPANLFNTLTTKTGTGRTESVKPPFRPYMESGVVIGGKFYGQKLDLGPAPTSATGQWSFGSGFSYTGSALGSTVTPVLGGTGTVGTPGVLNLFAYPNASPNIAFAGSKVATPENEQLMGSATESQVGPKKTTEILGPDDLVLRVDVLGRVILARGPWELATLNVAPPFGMESGTPARMAAPLPDQLPQVNYRLVANGNSSGEAFELQVEDPSGQFKKVVLPDGVVLQPAAKKPPQAKAASQVGNMLKQQITAFCLQYAKLPPEAGMLYKIAEPALQRQHRPAANVLQAGYELGANGELNPDSNPKAYIDAIRQYAVWAEEEGWDEQQFTEHWIERTKKNAQAMNIAWSPQMENALRAAAPNRWRDITKVRNKAKSMMQSDSSPAF